MTNEQYYWYVRRPQMLRAYAMANNLHQVVGAGDSDNSVKAASQEEVRKAFEEAKDGDVIKLTAPITMDDGQQSIMISADIGLNLNGQEIKATTLAGDTKDAVFAVKRGGTLTINGNGTVDGSASDSVYAAIKTTVKGETATGDTAKLIINNGTFKGQYYAITGNGGRQNTDVTINGGTFEGTHENDNMAYYHPENGVLTINGGTFIGNDGIIVKSGTVVVNDCSLSANGLSVQFHHNRSGWNCTGDGFVVEQCDYPGLSATVTINGGTFYSENGKPVASYAQEGYTALSGFVYGGKFNKPLDLSVINPACEQNLVDGWYVVTTK